MCVEFSGFKLTAALFKELIEVQENLYSGFKCKTLQGTQSKSYYYLNIDKLMFFRQVECDFNIFDLYVKCSSGTIKRND